MARVKFIRDEEPNIRSLETNGEVIDGALYVATDTGTMWMGTGTSTLLQIRDNIDTIITNYAGADKAGGPANEVKNTGKGSSDIERHVWFSDSDIETKRVSNDNFKYNPVGNIISSNISGNANTSTTTSSIIDYNNENSVIKIGFSGAGLTSSQIAYGLGYTKDKKIKNVSKEEYQKWLDLDSLSIGEQQLSWGSQEKSRKGDITPIGMALSFEHSANRLAFIDGNALTCEYSSDNGVTWKDYNFSKDEKTAFCTTRKDISVGRINSETNYTTDCQTRITINAQPYVYTNPRKLLINVNISGKMNVLIEYKKGASGSEWQTYGTYPLSGGSSWNDIPLILTTLGGFPNQPDNNWYLRLTFIITSVSSSVGQTVASVLGIRLFGNNNWGEASSIAKKGPMSGTGHLYSYDMNANAFFPGEITAKGFIGTATKATQDANGNIINATYAKKDSLAAVATTGSYSDLKEKPVIPIVVNNLVSNDTSSALSAAQGKILKDSIDNLPSPMVFKGTVGVEGTVTSLPIATKTNTGYTYKVITAGIYANIAAEAGDTFVSDGSAWVLIPSGDEPNGTVTNIATGSGLIGGPITSTGIISLEKSGVVAGSYGPNADVTGTNDTTIIVPQITVDDMGRVTKIINRTLTNKNTDTNTWNALKGATSSTDGVAGYAPAPAKGAQNSFLRGDATWQTITKSTIGLGNVDNTADANKSVKYATSAGSANTASVANSVAWNNVTGAPTIPTIESITDIEIDTLFTQVFG